MRFSQSQQRENNTTKIRINLGDFEHRAKQINIHDFQQFFSSRYFISNGFRLSGNSIEKDI
jgi:hypothetical protein